MLSLSPTQQYKDVAIYRHILIGRYADGQVKKAMRLYNKLTKSIAEYCLRREILDTKGQYKECRKHIRIECLKYRDMLYTQLQQELKGFIKEQASWIYEHSPVELKKADNDKILNDVNFLAFSDTDTIKGYVQRLFNQIYQLWNSQLSIAYRTKLPMKEMVQIIIGGA